MIERQPVAVPSSRIFVTQKGVYVAHEKKDILGRGTYGVVYRAQLESDPAVMKAIKIFSPDTMDEAEGIPSTTLREINALKTIVHPNVMTAEEVIIPEARTAMDMFFVMELCKGTLKDKLLDLISTQLNNDPIWLDPPSNMSLPKSYVKHAKVIAWQLLNALAVVHSRGVMHRDLKPVNILWGFDDLLKLADFGLARFVRGNQNADHSMLQQTGEVQTMWYRAPEVLLGDEKYGLLVDDWSLGCVIAELFRFRRNSAGRIEPAPLFQGRSDIGTLMIIFETLGTPQPQTNVGHDYLSKLKYWSEHFPQWTTDTITKRLPLLDAQGHEVVASLLKMSPTERKAARFLLNHPWFDEVKPLLKQFIPWFRGFEEDYKRMLAVDRLPLPKTMKEVSQMQQRQQRVETFAKDEHIQIPPAGDVSAKAEPFRTHSDQNHSPDAFKENESALTTQQTSENHLNQHKKIGLAEEDNRESPGEAEDENQSPSGANRYVLLGSSISSTSNLMSDDFVNEKCDARQHFAKEIQNRRPLLCDLKKKEFKPPTKNPAPLRKPQPLSQPEKKPRQAAARMQKASVLPKTSHLWTSFRPKSPSKAAKTAGPKQQQLLFSENGPPKAKTLVRKGGPRTRSVTALEQA